MQRAEFLNPEVDVIEFEAEDVITTSPGGGLIDGGDDDNESGSTDWGDLGWH